MNLVKKIIIFSVGYSILFFLLRYFELNKIIQSENISGIGWLYSTIGLVFGLTSAFVIQTEWDNWGNLENSIREEINGLRQLATLGSHASSNDFTKGVILSIRNYLKKVIKNWQENGDYFKKNREVDEALAFVEEDIYELFNKDRRLAVIAFEIFSDVLVYREHRIHYSARHLPITLKLLLVFSTVLIIGLSNFMGIKTLWLAYLFNISIAILAYLIYLVIDDLNHPRRPGGWHVTNKPYIELLRKINKMLNK